MPKKLNILHLLYSDLFHQSNQNSQTLYVCVRECHNGNKISKYLTHQNKMSELSLRYVIKECKDNTREYNDWQCRMLVLLDFENYYKKNKNFDTIPYP